MDSRNICEWNCWLRLDDWVDMDDRGKSLRRPMGFWLVTGWHWLGKLWDVETRRDVDEDGQKQEEGQFCPKHVEAELLQSSQPEWDDCIETSMIQLTGNSTVTSELEQKMKIWAVRRGRRLGNWPVAEVKTGKRFKNLPSEQCQSY